MSRRDQTSRSHGGRLESPRSAEPRPTGRHSGALTTGRDPANAAVQARARTAEGRGPEEAAPTTPGRSRRASLGLLGVRYGIGIALVIASIVLVVVNPGGFGLEGFGMAAGSGLSVLLLNYLYRMGVSGDLEREREEEARRYLAEHGHWPDEEPGRRRR